MWLHHGVRRQRRRLWCGLVHNCINAPPDAASQIEQLVAIHCNTKACGDMCLQHGRVADGKQPTLGEDGLVERGVAAQRAARPL